MGVFSNTPEGWGEPFQYINLKSADHALVLEETDSSVETRLVSRIVFLDAGTANAFLLMPPATAIVGGPFIFLNVTPLDREIPLIDVDTFRALIETGEGIQAFSDGTRWHFGMHGSST